MTIELVNMKYSIPFPANDIFELIVPIVLEKFSPEQISIGGDTALAARWNHRKTTDINLFMKFEDFRSMIEFLETRLFQVPGLLDLRCGEDWYRGYFAEGEFYIAVTYPLLPAESITTPDKSEYGEFRLEFVDEILAKILRFRMYGNGEFLARDFYDLVTAEEKDQEALNRALSVLKWDQRETLAKEINSIWSKIPLVGQPLEGVHRPEWLSDLALRTSAIIANAPHMDS